MIEGIWKEVWTIVENLTVIQFFMWGSCGVVDGTKFDHHLTLNSLAKCAGKDSSIFSKFDMKSGF